MNKKIGLSILMISILALGVTAVIIEYFGQVTTTLSVVAPIQVEGDTEVSLDAQNDATIAGNELVVTNNADYSIPITVSSTENEYIATTHKGKLTLAEKVVDFGAVKWDLVVDGKTATVDYAIDGEHFTAEISDGAIEGYELIYYKDNSDRYNNPATAIGVADVEGDLPYAEDGNAADIDYCATEEYVTCHGAKIWYVPSNAVTAGVIDWSRADEFLFETALIQYNTEGVVTMYPGMELTLYPLFDLSFPIMYEGDVEISTTIDLFEEV